MQLLFITTHIYIAGRTRRMHGGGAGQIGNRAEIWSKNKLVLHV